MKKLYLLFIILFIAGSAVRRNLHGDEIEQRFEKKVFFLKNLGSIPYRLLKPKNFNKKNRYPLILFLHGAGERGNDNSRQLHVGLHIFASKAHMALYPCFIVAPQCPRDKQWVTVDLKAAEHRMPSKPSRPMALALALTRYLIKTLPVDTKRIYITGYSMGGFGTWDAIQREPKFFSAAVPVCGGGDISGACSMAAIPLWVFHGARDHIINVNRSRTMVTAIKKCGGHPLYTEYPKINHFSWGYAYSNIKLFIWLFKQHK